MIKYIAIVFCFVSCISSKKLIDGYEVIRYKERSPYVPEYKLQEYLLDVPKGGKLTKANAGDYCREYRVSYSDSSVLYIINDRDAGSRLNYENRFKKNIKSIIRDPQSDSLVIAGVQEDGRYWKEKYVGEMVVGYVNAKAGQLPAYENSLLTLRKAK